MKIMKDIQTIRQTVEKVFCNKCGKSIKDDMSLEGCEIIVDFGYGSNKDFQRHKFDLCDNCYDEIVKGFKIKVDIKECDWSY